MKRSRMVRKDYKRKDIRVRSDESVREDRGGRSDTSAGKPRDGEVVKVIGSCKRETSIAGRTRCANEC
jgi:hypothetical protein